MRANYTAHTVGGSVTMILALVASVAEVVLCSGLAMRLCWSSFRASGVERIGLCIVSTIVTAATASAQSYCGRSKVAAPRNNTPKPTQKVHSKDLSKGLISAISRLFSSRHISASILVANVVRRMISPLMFSLTSSIFLCSLNVRPAAARSVVS